MKGPGYNKARLSWREVLSEPPRDELERQIIGMNRLIGFCAGLLLVITLSAVPLIWLYVVVIADIMIS